MKRIRKKCIISSIAKCALKFNYNCIKDVKILIYITGDTHGEVERLVPSKLRALKEGDTLIVCGDFGFIWDGSKKEQKILKQLGKRKYNICFIDGTHENFSLLNGYGVSEWNGGKVHKIISTTLCAAKYIILTAKACLQWAAAKAPILTYAPRTTAGRVTKYLRRMSFWRVQKILKSTAFPLI